MEQPLTGGLVMLGTLALGQVTLSMFHVRDQAFQEFWRKGLFRDWLARTEDAEHQRQKREVQYQGFKKTLPLWILCNDFTTIFLIFINIFSLLQLKQAMAMTFCASVPLFGMTLRYVMDTGGQHSTTRDTALIFFMVSGAILSAPVQMQPLGMLGKAVILEIVPEPSLYFRLQLATTPLTAILQWWLKPPMDAMDMDFMCLMFNECIGVLGLFLAHSRNEWTLSKQVIATMFAEESAAEAKSFCEAVRQLLSVTCDACSALSYDLQVSQPSVSLLDLLKVEPADILQKPFSEFVTPEDQEHFQSIVSFSSKTPSSGVVHLLDGKQDSFPAKVFLVQLSGRAGYFLGISKEGSEPPDGGTDMQVLLGNIGGKFLEPTDHPDGESVGASNEILYYEPAKMAVPQGQEMEEVTKISLVIDAFSEDLGYIIKSVTFDFADLPVEKQKRLPNLLEWLDPRWRMAMAKWIEEEVNSSFHGTHPRALKEVEFVSPGPSGQSMSGTFRLTCEHLNEDCSGMCAQIEIQNLRF